MSNNVLKGADLIQAVLAYYTTPLNIIPTIQSVAAGDAMNTISGILQLSVGSVQMIGKVIPNWVSVGASAAGLVASANALTSEYQRTGNVKTADLLSALGGAIAVTSTLSLMLVGASVIAPATIAVTVAVTVATSALTALAIVAGRYDHQIEVQSAIDTLKGYFLSVGQALGDRYQDALERLREGELSEFGAKADISLLEDGRVKIKSLNGASTALIDPSKVSDFGVNQDGQVFVRTLSENQPDELDKTISFKNDGSVIVSSNGSVLFEAKSGAVISIGESGLSATQTETLSQSTYSLNNDGSQSWSHISGSTLVEYRKPSNGEIEVVNWTQNGQTHTSNAGLDSFLYQSTKTQIENQAQAEVIRQVEKLNTAMDVPADGVITALDNASAQNLVGARIAYQNLPNRWLPASLGGSISSSLLLSSNFSAEVQQTLSLLSQKRWANFAPPRTGIVTVYNSDGTIASVTTTRFEDFFKDGHIIVQPRSSNRGLSSNMNDGNEVEDSVDWVPGAGAVIFSDYVSKGFAALAGAQAKAVVTALERKPINVSSLVSSLQTWMQTRRYGTSNGYSNPLIPGPTDHSMIAIYSGESPSISYNRQYSTAGVDALDLLQKSEQFSSTVVGVATKINSSMDSLIDAQLAAQKANISAVRDDRNSANDQAVLASDLLGAAVASYLRSNAVAAQLNGKVENLRLELNRLVPINIDYLYHLPGGYTFYSPGDAQFAAVASTAFASSLEILKNLKISLDTLLSEYSHEGCH